MTPEERLKQRNERIERKMINITKALEQNEEKIRKIDFSNIKLRRTLLSLQQELEQPLVDTKPSEEERKEQSIRDKERMESEFSQFLQSRIYNK